MTLRWPSLRVRWVILSNLFGFAFVACMQRTSFSVAAVGGKWSDRLAVRLGLRIGYRAIPLIALPLAGLLLLLGVESTSPYWAVGALSLAFAAIEMTEGPYGAATTAIVSGVMWLWIDGGRALKN
jgi:hypothetical protein